MFGFTNLRLSRTFVFDNVPPDIFETLQASADDPSIS